MWKRGAARLISTIAECPKPTMDTGCTHCMPPDMSKFPEPTRPVPPTPFHTRHLVIHTGHSNWPSKPQDEPGSLMEALKPLTRKYMGSFDPQSTVIVHNSDLPTSQPGVASAHVYPDNIYFPRIQLDQVETFASDVLGGKNLAETQLATESVKNPMILVCGHGNRDERCGIIAPLLINELEKVLMHHGLLYDVDSNPDGVLIGQCSHVGGHIVSCQSLLPLRLQCANYYKNSSLRVI